MWTLAILAVLAGGSAWRASWIAHRLLRSWVSRIVRERSDSVYDLAVGQVRLNFPLRRVSVDSLVVTTNPVANARRSRQLATVGLVFRDCTISGVHLVSLVRSQGLIASSFGCQSVDARFVVPEGEPDPDLGPTPPGTPGAMVVLQHGLRLPAFAPRVKIAYTAFPAIALDFHVRHAKGGDSHVELEHFRWSMRDFDLYPSDPASATRPMFSASIELSAENLVFHPDSATVLRVAKLSASLTDSTLDVLDFSVAPSVGRDAYLNGKPYRRKYTALRIAHLAGRGADVGGLLLGKGLRSRTALVDSMLVDIVNDHRLPVKPGGAMDHRRTPQQWIAGLDRPVNVDSVFIRHGKVLYRLRNTGHPEFGLISFARINAIAVGVNTSVAGATARAPMHIAATTFFQDTGLLTVRFDVPLRARRFQMTYRGTLGTMPADRVAQFVGATTPVRIAHGQVDGIEFAGTIADGFTTGTATPMYHDFAFAVTQENATGLAARNGFVGGVARKVMSFAGNWQKVHASNPEGRHGVPRVGLIRHAFDPDEALPDYLWYGLRDGLVQVIAR